MHRQIRIAAGSLAFRVNRCLSYLGFSRGEVAERLQGRRSERHFFLSIGQPASDFTTPRSLERFDIPEGTLDHSAG